MAINVVVIGGGYAGVLAASRLAGRAANASVTLVNASDAFVERIRLHQKVAGGGPTNVALRSLLATGVRLEVGTVTSLALDERRVMLRSGQELAFDRLVLAVGSGARDSSVPGLAVGVESDALRARAKVAEAAARHGRVIVVGGGLTGIETASEVAEVHPSLSVELVTRESLGGGFSVRGQSAIRAGLEALRVKVHEGQRVASFDVDGVTLAGGARLTSDVTLWAGGLAVPSLARESGLAVDARGRVVVDVALRSISHPEVYAVGDAANLEDRIGVPVRMACATAMPMGAHAADNLARELRGEAPGAFALGYAGQAVSLGRARGVAQPVRFDDTPVSFVLRGRLGAFLKEAVCRYTLASLRAVARSPGRYHWPRRPLPFLAPLVVQKALP